MGSKITMTLHEAIHKLGGYQSHLIFMATVEKARIENLLNKETFSPQAAKVFEKLKRDFDEVEAISKESFDLLEDIKNVVYAKINADEIKLEHTDCSD